MLRTSISAAGTTILFLVLAPVVTLAADCERMPRTATVPIDELIERSPRIALVRVAGPEETSSAETDDPTVSLDLDAARRKVTEGGTELVDRANPDASIAILEVELELKGSGAPRLFRPNLAPDRPMHDFDGHRDEAFWNDATSGLVGFDEECRAFARFEPGETYLLFEGPAHVKGAELIASGDDAWLAYVKERLEE